MDSILKWMWVIRRFNFFRFRMRREVPSLFIVVKMGEIHKQLARGEGAITFKRSIDSISLATVATGCGPALWWDRNKIQADTLGNKVKDTLIPGKQSPPLITCSHHLQRAKGKGYSWNTYLLFSPRRRPRILLVAAL